VHVFKHKEWAVRNSCTMLFAALMQRAVTNQKNAATNQGDKNVALGGGGQSTALTALHEARKRVVTTTTAEAAAVPAAGALSQHQLQQQQQQAGSASKFATASAATSTTSRLEGGTTAAEFFHRFPSLAPFILAELSSATVTTSTTATMGMHPSLVPLLLLLSRLTPSSSEALDRPVTLDARVYAAATATSVSNVAKPAASVSVSVSVNSVGDENQETPMADDEDPRSVKGGASMTTISLGHFLEVLLSLVLKCRSQRFHAARTMAARAAASLCPPALAPLLASHLAASLPLVAASTSPTTAATTTTAGNAKALSPGAVSSPPQSPARFPLLPATLAAAAAFSSPAAITTNSMHGTLLVVAALSACAFASTEGPHSFLGGDVENDGAHGAGAGSHSGVGGGGGASVLLRGFLQVLSQRVVPLVAGAGVPPPLRIVALECLCVVRPYRASVGAVASWWWWQDRDCLEAASPSSLPPSPPPFLVLSPSKALAAAAEELVLVLSYDQNDAVTRPHGGDIDSPPAPLALPSSSLFERLAVPWLSELRAKVARLAVFAAFEGGPQGAAVLRRLLLSRDHDAQVAAVKAVKKVLTHSELKGFTFLGVELKGLELVLAQALEGCDYPPTQRRLLRCLCVLGACFSKTTPSVLAFLPPPAAAAAAEGGGENCAVAWFTLERLHDWPHTNLFRSPAPTTTTTASPPERGITSLGEEQEEGGVWAASAEQGGDGEVCARALELMGWRLDQEMTTRRRSQRQQQDGGESRQATGGGGGGAVAKQWLARLKRASSTHVKAHLRQAAVHSVKASNVLKSLLALSPPLPLVSPEGESEEEQGEWVKVVVGAWFVCLTLAFDDDAAVRDSAASVLFNASLLTTSTSSLPLLGPPTQASTSSSSSLSPSRPCNERAIELAMDSFTDLVVLQSSTAGASSSSSSSSSSIVDVYAEHLMELWRDALKTTSAGSSSSSSGDGGGVMREEGEEKEDKDDGGERKKNTKKRKNEDGGSETHKAGGTAKTQVAGDSDADGGGGGPAENEVGGGDERMIFETEESNLYSEPVLVAQLVVRQLRKLALAAAASGEASTQRFNMGRGGSGGGGGGGLAGAIATLEGALLAVLRSSLRLLEQAQGASTETSAVATKEAAKATAGAVVTSSSSAAVALTTPLVMSGAAVMHFRRTFVGAAALGLLGISARREELREDDEPRQGGGGGGDNSAATKLLVLSERGGRAVELAVQQLQAHPAYEDNIHPLVRQVIDSSAFFCGGDGGGGWKSEHRDLEGGGRGGYFFLSASPVLSAKLP